MKKSFIKRTKDQFTTRREFVKATWKIAAFSSLAGGAVPYLNEVANKEPDETFTGKSEKSLTPIRPDEDIKVTRIETFVLKNSWVFVKISTDAGITGWGEMLKDDAKACAAGALEVGNYLIGKDPRQVVHHWQA
ncbi:MAG TPA: hypothetical protein DDW27_17480, partial [Bacteroidales bacterium]|nr:hypothetical protein [Bacteroidales bacterium]